MLIYLLFAESSTSDSAALLDHSRWLEMWNRIVEFLPQLAVSGLIVLVSWIAGRIVDRLIQRAGRLRNTNADAVGIIATAVRWTIISIGLVTGLGTVGVNVSAMVAGLGLTGLALGIALKDVVSNSIAGILILIYKPFRRGDRISATALEGTVTQIDLRYTTLETADRRILIPNSSLFVNSIIVFRTNAPTTPLTLSDSQSPPP
ncbi:MAG: mechanosensitive ion channel [Planctomycetota bacterium]|nr:mechanosensitive ion channel [Planctomycetota bacterium]